MTDTNSKTVRWHLEDLIEVLRNVEISAVRVEGAFVSLTVVVGNLTFTADSKAVK